MCEVALTVAHMPRNLSVEFGKRFKKNRWYYVSRKFAFDIMGYHRQFEC